MRNLVILGSTGSVGTQVLDVVRTFSSELNVSALITGSNFDLFKNQIIEFKPQWINSNCTSMQKHELYSLGCIEKSIEEIVTLPEVDLVVTATSGDIALVPTLIAINHKKDIALANKESIVIAGKQLVSKARENDVEIFPLDSEPNAIWQCLRGEDKGINKLIVTASGGALKDFPLNELYAVTPEQALNHPTWKMGDKITIDSATLMNKAFEVIEAHYLFDIGWEDIEVVIHPQSLIHSMVEFVDGSIKAHIGKPDMRMPIQYSLLYPQRKSNIELSRLDLLDVGEFSFKELDLDRYPCFVLGLEYGKKGATWPAVLSGADDMAVNLFLSGKLHYTEIAEVIREATKMHQPVSNPDVYQALEASNWAKQQVANLVK
jgi:1-deoxy-D-xylulose-5-phosphate reductoisomerase